ncbi:MAG: hypothetical protein V3S44_01770, partial [Alphaproteobacteria bacterium]
VALGLGGAVVILGAGLADLPLPRDASDWLALAAGVMFAGSATILSRAGGSGELERVFAAFALASLIALAAVLLGPGDLLPPAGVVVDAAPLVFAVVIFMLLPLSWLVIWGAGRLDPGRVAILLLFEVLAAAVSAAILTDEPFGANTFIGGALILTAAALEGLAPEPSQAIMRRTANTRPSGPRGQP